MTKTQYTHRILIIVPDELRDVANQLALVTGLERGSIWTY